MVPKIRAEAVRAARMLAWKTSVALRKGFASKRGPCVWPDSPDGLLRLHVGCGEVIIPGYINVDERAFPHVHLVTDVTDLSSIPDGVAEEVYASHVLEHLPFRQTNAAIWEWKRVLRTGGLLRLAVPDLDLIVQAYLQSDRTVEKIRGPLIGGQHYPGDFHKAIFNEKFLRKLLEAEGFVSIERFNPREVLPSHVHDSSTHPASLNIKARKR